MLEMRDFVRAFERAAKDKTGLPVIKLFILGIMAGMAVGLGACVANTVSHAFTNQSVIRICCGMLFPLNLFIVVMMRAELFTGNCLLLIPVLTKKATVGGMLRNWAIVYLGNLAGGCLLALACTFAGQMNLSGGELAVYTIKVAAGKCSLGFFMALVLGIFCNILVCIGVMCGSRAKSIPGRAIGLFIPICFFVICGFEHSVANMYYIPAGLMANSVPQYASLAAQAGIDTSSLTVAGFIFRNLIPVTLGNIIGGCAVSLYIWWFDGGE